MMSMMSEKGYKWDAWDKQKGKAKEDAMAEYDELTVEGLIREIIDKAIACDSVSSKIEDGPNTLEEYDQLTSGS